MRDAGLLGVLVARAGADPVADGDRADVVETLGDHPLAGVELAEHPVLHGRIVVARHDPAEADREVRPSRCAADRRILASNGVADSAADALGEASSAVARVARLGRAGPREHDVGRRRPRLEGCVVESPCSCRSLGERSDQTSASCRRPCSQIERRSRPSSWNPQRSATCCDGAFSGCVRISIRPTPASNSHAQTSRTERVTRPRPRPALAGEVRQLPVVALALRRDDGADDGVGRVGDREVPARPGAPAVAHRLQQLVEVALASAARACSASGGRAGRPSSRAPRGDRSRAAAGA